MQIGALNVRRSAFIEASPARVWEEFASPGRVAGWLNLGHTLHELELAVGGRVRLSVDIDGAEQFFGGRVVSFVSEVELSFAINWEAAEMAWPLDTYWTFRLTPCYGGTLVELFHHGFERLGTQAGEALLAYEWGWDVKHLDALRAAVTG